MPSGKEIAFTLRSEDSFAHHYIEYKLFLIGSMGSIDDIQTDTRCIR